MLRNYNSCSCQVKNKVFKVVFEKKNVEQFVCRFQNLETSDPLSFFGLGICILVLWYYLEFISYSPTFACFGNLGVPSVSSRLKRLGTLGTSFVEVTNIKNKGKEDSRTLLFFSS